jgi:anti-sigma regulatory factor (Ser/Thr protein kinase)
VGSATGMDPVRRTFSPSEGAVAAARSFALETAQGWDYSFDDVVDAILVVSELSTNAIRHAQTPFEIRLQRTDRSIIVEVSDSSAAPAVVRTPVEGVIGGRGLMIVEQIASEWGSRPEPQGGKTVWAELVLK